MTSSSLVCLSRRGRPDRVERLRRRQKNHLVASGLEFAHASRRLVKCYHAKGRGFGPDETQANMSFFTQGRSFTGACQGARDAIPPASNGTPPWGMVAVEKFLSAKTRLSAGCFSRRARLKKGPRRARRGTT
jgi:hypothetical protein